MPSLLAFVLLLPAAVVAPAAAQTHAAATQQRTLSGTVTDGREPLHNAVVELKNPATHAVTSYLTGDDGHYVFKHLDSNADLTVSAAFRGHRSAERSVSMFDSHLEKTIDLKIDLDK